MEKLDLRKQLKNLYQPPAKQPVLVEVPALQFATISGELEPDVAGPGVSPVFHEAMQAMYGIAYTLKFASKKREVDAVDYPVMPLEGLWWVERGEFSFTERGNWCWKLMIMQPDHIDAAMFEDALTQVRKKRPSPALERVRLERFHEGLSAQVMHLGPYSEEQPTIERLHAFAEESGYKLRGDHHEIYLGDPRSAAPEKLKTVLRHPVEKR